MKKVPLFITSLFLFATGIYAQGKKEGTKHPVAAPGFADAGISHYAVVAPLLKGYGSDSLSQVVLKEMGCRYARQGNSRYFDPAKDSPPAVPGYTMGSDDKLKEHTRAALKNLQAGQILALTVHGAPDLAHSGFTTDISVFTDYLACTKARHFNAVAVRDAGRSVSVK